MSRRAQSGFKIFQILSRVVLNYVFVLVLAALLFASGVWDILHQNPIMGLVYLVGASALLALIVISIGALRYRTRVAMAETLKKHGLCSRCGYDLRATRARCPECGLLILNPRPFETTIEI